MSCAERCWQEGRATNWSSAYKASGEFVDYDDIQEALNMKKDIPESQYEISSYWQDKGCNTDFYGNILWFSLFMIRI